MGSQCRCCGSTIEGMPRRYTGAQLRTAFARGVRSATAADPRPMEAIEVCASCATRIDGALYSGAGAIIAPGDPSVVPSRGVIARLKSFFAV